MDAHIDRFLSYLSVEKGLSRNTLSAYLQDLQKFVAFAEKRGILRIDQVHRREIFDFFSELRSRSLASSSMTRMLSTLRTFFKFLSSEG
ncbi:MAG TPA: site-specific integrase, partial [Candidatus Manganitrophaceae bacterium]|nr:site-specific integrase [Candidatus Manganitrophaceae bacterium]